MFVHTEQPVHGNWRRGFLLTQEWQDTDGGCQALFWGKGEDGVFCLRVGLRPVLFVPQGINISTDIPIAERRSLPLRSFQGSPVDALYFLSQGDLFDARAKLRESGISIYEGDIVPSERHLMERFIHASCAFLGPCSSSGGVQYYDQPRMQHAEYLPCLSRMSFDIETGSDQQLYAIGCHFIDGAHQERHVFMAAHGRRHKNSSVSYCEDSTGALQAFLDLVARLDPDLLCGWNIIGFDLPFLARIANETGLTLALSRGGGAARVAEMDGRWTVQISGRVVVDGIPALKGASFAFEDYRLETVSQTLLGEGKKLTFESTDKQAEIDRLFRKDPEQLAEYNLRDAELVNRIFEKSGLVELLISRSIASGMLLEKLGRSVAAFDHFFLPRLHRKGFVAPDRDALQDAAALPGGLVLPSQPGLYEHVVVFDFRSLYPSIIRTFKICPYAWVMGHVEPVRTPTGAVFSSKEHILPDYIESLMTLRAQARTENRPELAQAIKILMNSFYGIMGTPNSRFYNPVLPISITGTGQWILRTARDFLSEQGYRVLYGDTDSLFVLLQKSDTRAPHEAGARLASMVTRFLADKLAQEYHVTSALELEFQRYCRRFYLPVARNLRAAHNEDLLGDSHPDGAAKRYAGLVQQPDGNTELWVTGLECVRSDWTPLARRLQRELLGRMFHGEPVDAWLREQMRELKAGRLDNELVYRRRLRKPASAYTHNLPPHIKAVLQLPPEKRSGAIAYVITRRGPVPLENSHADIDYEHYIDKQVRAVVDDILAMQGLHFDEILSGEEQLRLF